MPMHECQRMLVRYALDVGAFCCRCRLVLLYMSTKLFDEWGGGFSLYFYLILPCFTLHSCVDDVVNTAAFWSWLRFGG
jgi:hypothetical protein